MSKAFTSILILLTFLIVCSANLIGDMQAFQSHNESIISKDKSTSILESNLISEGEELLADLSIQKQSSKTNLYNGVSESDNLAFLNVENNITENSETLTNELENILNSISLLKEELTKKIKILSDIITKIKVNTSKKEIEPKKKKNTFIHEFNNEEVSIKDGIDLIKRINDFTEAIETTTKVKTLIIENVKLSENDFESICNSIKKNKSLTELHLIKNNLGVKGAELVAQLINDNPRITVLEISHNNITNAGAISLSEALLTNDNLINLIVTSDLIDDVGAMHILNSVKFHPRISKIVLSDNNLTNLLIPKLEHILEKNKKMKVRLDEIKFTHNIQDLYQNDRIIYKSRN